MRRADSGKGTGKAILTVAVLAAIAFAAVQILPVYVHNYELQDQLRQVSIQVMAGQHTTVDAVRNAVLEKARDLDLPVKPDDVKIVLTGGKITIDLNYTVPIDLKVYTLYLHFTPSAENRAIL